MANNLQNHSRAFITHKIDEATKTLSIYISAAKIDLPEDLSSPENINEARASILTIIKTLEDAKQALDRLQKDISVSDVKPGDYVRHTKGDKNVYVVVEDDKIKPNDYAPSKVRLSDLINGNFEKWIPQFNELVIFIDPETNLPQVARYYNNPLRHKDFKIIPILKNDFGLEFPKDKEK